MRSSPAYGTDPGVFLHGMDPGAQLAGLTHTWWCNVYMGSTSEHSRHIARSRGGRLVSNTPIEREIGKESLHCGLRTRTSLWEQQEDCCFSVFGLEELKDLQSS